MDNNQIYNMLIISGPSGSGKSTLTKFLQQYIPNLYFSISTTTRNKRYGEQNGREYYFVSREDFLHGIQAGDFLEYEEVHGNFYGTSKKQIANAIANNQFILYDVDVKGHNNLKQYYPFAKSVFITTKDLQTLEQRLQQRNTDNPEIIQKRLLNAQEELKYANTFDYLLINDNIADSKDTILHIAKSILYLNHTQRLESLLQKYKN